MNATPSPNLRVTLSLDTGEPRTTWADLRAFVALGADVPDDCPIGLDMDDNFDLQGLWLDGPVIS